MRCQRRDNLNTKNVQEAGVRQYDLGSGLRVTLARAYGPLKSVRQVRSNTQYRTYRGPVEKLLQRQSGS